MQIIVGALLTRDRVHLERKRKFPVRRQKLFRPGWFTDVCHWVFNQTIVNVGVVIGAIPLYILLGWTINPSLQRAIARQPGYLQFVEAVIVAEVSFYLVHRLFHQVPSLWKFHFFHHRARTLRRSGKRSLSSLRYDCC